MPVALKALEGSTKDGWDQRLQVAKLLLIAARFSTPSCGELTKKPLEPFELGENSFEGRETLCAVFGSEELKNRPRVRIVCLLVESLGLSEEIRVQWRQHLSTRTAERCSSRRACPEYHHGSVRSRDANTAKQHARIMFSRSDATRLSERLRGAPLLVAEEH